VELFGQEFARRAVREAIEVSHLLEVARNVFDERPFDVCRRDLVLRHRRLDGSLDKLGESRGVEFAARIKPIPPLKFRQRFLEIFAVAPVDDAGREAGT
jgi:hypothetical protein